MSRNLQKVENLLPVAPQTGRLGQLAQLQKEVRELRNENFGLRPLKTEMARLRAGLADWFYGASEANL